MKSMSLPLKAVVLVAVLAAGLAAGLGIGQVRIKKERKIFEDTMKDVNRKIALVQKNIADQQAEAEATMQQQQRSDQDKLDRLGSQNKALAAVLVTLREQMKKTEDRARQSDSAYARAAKDLQKADRENKELTQKSKKETERIQALQAEQKKTTGESRTFQAQLEKTAGKLGSCRSDNAALVAIADGLVKKYKNKGLGAVLLQKEPFTQIKQVELDRLAQKYLDEIEQKKFSNK